jgi:hypothetical protein
VIVIEDASLQIRTHTMILGFIRMILVVGRPYIGVQYPFDKDGSVDSDLDLTRGDLAKHVVAYTVLDLERSLDHGRMPLIIENPPFLLR